MGDKNFTLVRSICEILKEVNEFNPAEIERIIKEEVVNLDPVQAKKVQKLVLDFGQDKVYCRDLNIIGKDYVNLDKDAINKIKVFAYILVKESHPQAQIFTLYCQKNVTGEAK